MSKIITPGRKKAPIVKICVPYYNNVPIEMMEIWEHLHMKGIPGYKVMLTRQVSTIITFARNQLVEEPPQLPWDFVFFIDDDMGFEEQLRRSMVVVEHEGVEYKVPYMVGEFKKILDHNKDICGGWYCQRSDPHAPLVFDLMDENNQEGPWVHCFYTPNEGLQKVDALATGFLCIKRTVFDAFKERWGQRLNIRDNYLDWLKANDLKSLPFPVREYLEKCARADMFEPFWIDRIYDRTQDKWLNVGEDIFFCREARKMGFDIWVDWSVMVGHLTRLYFHPETYREAYMPRAIEHHLEWCRKNNHWTGAALKYLEDHPEKREVKDPA